MTRHSLLVTRHFHYGVDIADTLLAVDAARAGDTVCSLDRDFEKLPVPWEPPPPV
jgi:predicted nucleic acid-binding protein